MKKIIISFLLIFLSLAIVACGGNSDSSSSASSSAAVIFEQIEDNGENYTIDDFIAIGYKKGKTVKESKLMDGMTTYVENT